MSRVKRGLASHKRHKNLFKLTRGYRGSRNNLVRMARQATLNAGIFAYRDRRVKKRDFRAQWITTISGALRAEGLKYSVFMHQMSEKGIELDRKVMAELVEKNPESFKKLVETVTK